jgi:hypothetical protein
MNIEHIPTRAEIRARRERLGCYSAPEPAREKLSPIIIEAEPEFEPEPVAEPSLPARSNIWFRIVGDRPADFITLADVRDAVCKHFGIDYLELCKRRQLKVVVYRRSIAIYLARELTTKSWPQIGRMFGGLDHTSAITASRRVEKAISKSVPATVADVAAIRVLLGRPD